MTRSPQILIIQTAFLGDVVLATALVESIKLEVPAATIDFVVRKGNEGLLANNPGLRFVYAWEKDRKYSSLMDIIHAARSVRYDYVINAQRFTTTGLLTVLCGAKASVGFDKNPLSMFFTYRIPHSVGSEHEVQRNLKLLEPLGIKREARPRLYPSAADEAQVKQYQSEDYITISPASVWFTKQFPAGRWIEFVKRLPKIRIFLLGAPGDKEMGDEMVRSLPGKGVENLAGQLSLLQSAALMSKARMNYVNDSAPLHLASATNAPVTAVFCSTVPDFGFGPLSDKSFIVQTSRNWIAVLAGFMGIVLARRVISNAQQGSRQNSYWKPWSGERVNAVNVFAGAPFRTTRDPLNRQNGLPHKLALS